TSLFGVFADDPELQRGDDAARELDLSFVLADSLDRFADGDLASIDVDAGYLELRGEIASGHRAEHLVALANQPLELQRHAADSSGHGFALDAILGDAALDHGFVVLELINVVLRGREGVPLGQEVVASVSVLYGDELASFADVRHILCENELHRHGRSYLPVTVKGTRAIIRARRTAVAMAR